MVSMQKAIPQRVQCYKHTIFFDDIVDVVIAERHELVGIQRSVKQALERVTAGGLVLMTLAIRNVVLVTIAVAALLSPDGGAFVIHSVVVSTNDLFDLLEFCRDNLALICLVFIHRVAVVIVIIILDKNFGLHGVSVFVFDIADVLFVVRRSHDFVILGIFILEPLFVIYRGN